MSPATSPTARSSDSGSSTDWGSEDRTSDPSDSEWVADEDSSPEPPSESEPSDSDDHDRPEPVSDVPWKQRGSGNRQSDSDDDDPEDEPSAEPESTASTATTPTPTPNSTGNDESALSDDPRLEDDDIGPAPPVADDDEDSLVLSGPTEDQEMPLSAHIEEMVRRLLIVVVVMALVSAATFPYANGLINFIWDSILAAGTSDQVKPRVFHPLSLVMARLKVATLAGLVIALPVFVYETYLFMRPGLYPRERRYYIAAIPTSLVLASAGVAFAFYLVLPLLFIYFLNYTEQTADIAFGLQETFGLMLLLMGFFAIIFQIPLFIMLAVMMGVTSRTWLTDRRLYFWGAFLGIAFITNPDPTGMVPIIVALSMVVLFEGTLLLLKWTERD
ncbi:twin-arginine translocase subunit TatC [Halocatena halophila]|uniref:twin-arginine translocase subunit TatC n=1 Tax=Halocatena halophila TaxID=2814576 RepID=UPI002ED0CE29